MATAALSFLSSTDLSYHLGTETRYRPQSSGADHAATRPGQLRPDRSSRCTVIAARYIATCLAASSSQSTIRVRQPGSVKPRSSMSRVRPTGFGECGAEPGHCGRVGVAGRTRVADD